MISVPDPREPPRRPRVAGLRTLRGQRIGRLGLSHGEGQVWHTWEWLGEAWPAVPFRMVPDAFEPPPAPGLSDVYPMPPEIRAVPRYAAFPPGRVDRIYRVMRVDCEPRPLALLVVAGSTLHWLEVDVGGALELAPSWLSFEPQATIAPELSLTRCLVQRRRPRGRTVAIEPEVHCAGGGAGSGGLGTASGRG